jgi:NhaP-type Na+/H+ and K+/H+ antiporter
MSPFVSTLALVGVVIMVAALLSGLVDRMRLPQVAMFLALGAAVGPAGLGLVDFALASPVLQSIATLALVLVLFTDAVSVDMRAVRTPRSRRLITWYGPRGLSSLLLVLLPVFAGIAGAERLFAPTALVVLLSVVVGL